MSELRVAIICSALAAIGPLSLTLYTPAMPQIATYFGTNTGATQLSISLFFVGFAVFQLICGPLSDAFGRKPVLIGFVGSYVVGCVLALIAPTIEILIFARLLQGAGAAVGITLSRAIVTDIFSFERAIRIQTFITIAMSAGPAIAPAVGGLLLLITDWHSTFWLMLVLGLGTLYAVTMMYSETAPQENRGVSMGRIADDFRHVLKSRPFVQLTLTMGCTNGIVYAHATMLPFVMIGDAGLSPTEFGLSMLMQTTGFFLASLVVRQLSSLISYYTMATIGISVIMIGCLTLTILIPVFGPSIPTVILPVALLGVGLAFTMPSLTVAALNEFKSRAGTAAALLGFVQMGCGLAGGMCAILFPTPTIAIGIVTPVMAAISLVSFSLWRFSHKPV